ncbi:MAG: CoA transferase, partial [Planctomycetaceae bacterium]
NFRPGVMDRLGIGYEVLREINPRLIYAASCGYGQTGPYVTRPGQDLLIQAMTGMTVLTGLAVGLCPGAGRIAHAGTITGWGYSGDGLGNLPTGNDFSAVAAGGGNWAVSLRYNGTLATWGYDLNGVVSNAPTSAGFTAIAAGYFHGYALRADGSIAAWGSDDQGQ